MGSATQSNRLTEAFNNPTMLDYNGLPPEIWLQIIDWATYDPSSYDTNTPFSAIPDDGLDTNLHHRAKLSAVCQVWKSWIARKLYRSVRIPEECHILYDTLNRSRDDDDLPYGQLVSCYFES